MSRASLHIVPLHEYPFVSDEDLAQASARALRAGWKSLREPAKVSEGGGSPGGVAMCARS
eukprot:652666-Pyramimonas_sp.AAC.1